MVGEQEAAAVLAIRFKKSRFWQQAISSVPGKVKFCVGECLLNDPVS